MSIKKTLVGLVAAALLLTGSGTALAQETDFPEQCAAIDAQAAQFNAAISAQRAQINALDAQLGPAYDATFAAYRAYLNNAELTFHAQVAAAEVLFGC